MMIQSYCKKTINNLKLMTNVVNLVSNVIGDEKTGKKY
jgi:hypothetical protein